MVILFKDGFQFSQILSMLFIDSHPRFWQIWISFHNLRQQAKIMHFFCCQYKFKCIIPYRITDFLCHFFIIGRSKWKRDFFVFFINLLPKKVYHFSIKSTYHLHEAINWFILFINPHYFRYMFQCCLSRASTCSKYLF